MSSNQYFASKPPSDTANILLSKATTWYNDLYSNGYLLKVRESWMAYHGAYYNTVNGGHKITFGGEQGELVQIAINHYRNIARHILEMITSNRPSFQARATNTDYKSLVQAKLGNDLLDYYMREKRMEKYLRQAVEYSIVLGSGYIKMEWNATSGEIYDMNEETGTPIYEGDVAFTNMSPYDVVFDTHKEDQDHNWVLCRSFKNKFDLAAKYPELENKIKGLSTKSDIMRFRMEIYSSDETEDVPVYEFFHKKTESMPEGRYLLFLDTNIILMDSPMPYRSLPVYRISPSDILGTPFGYTPMFDLLPIQEAVNSLYSTILTNQHAFGVQNIYVPRGADVTMKSLEGGLNIIEGNAGAGKPEAMNLTNTPGEIFSFLKTLEQQMEVISGVNSVARGNPEASLKSGTALALVQSMALQFISGLQQQYVELIEDVGTGLLDMLKDFAAVPRVAMIAGKSSKSYVAQDFNGDDLSQVQRVIVDMGNPMAKTTAGKLQMVTEMTQYGVITTPEQYLTVLTTGQLNAATDDLQVELLGIKGENEVLSEGEQVDALAIDHHVMHIKGHKAILADPSLRKDKRLSATILAHIQQHIDLLRNTDPGLLSILGEQPLPPVGGQQPGPQDPNANITPSAAPQSAQAPQGPEGLPPGPGDVPNMPNMPKVPAAALANPQLQAQAMGNVRNK
jgi:hypothetical protein